jgi:hypothetical protein
VTALTAARPGWQAPGSRRVNTARRPAPAPRRPTQLCGRRAWRSRRGARLGRHRGLEGGQPNDRGATPVLRHSGADRERAGGDAGTCRPRTMGYVLAVARNHRVTACPAIGAQRVDQVTAALLARAWNRYSAPATAPREHASSTGRG